MRSILYFAVSALAAIAAAQSGSDNAFKIPSGGYQFTAGKPTTLTWDPTTHGTVTLRLQEGSNTTPNDGTVIASHIPNSGSYTFVPPANVAPGSDYTIRISDDQNPSNFNFLPQFAISGATGGSTASVTASPTASTSGSTTGSPTPSMTTSSSSSSSTGSSTSSSSASSTSSSSTTSSAPTRSASATSAPNPNAAVPLTLSGHLLAAVMALMAFL